MPSVFDALGIRFQYPDNWSIDQISEGQGEQVIVSSPETAFWHLSKHPRDMELETLFDEALSTLRSVYQEMEVEPADEVVDEHELRGFDVRFYCLDLTNTSWLRGFQTPRATYLLICQAEDRELNRAGPVFRAMLASVLRNLAK